MNSEQKRYPAYQDTDPITFGKYKGRPLSDVPAHYLKWLWIGASYETYSKHYGDSPVNFSFKENVMLANYIWNSKSEIEKELGDTF